MSVIFFLLLLYLHSIIFEEFISRKTVDFEISDDGLDSGEIILEGKKRNLKTTYLTLIQVYRFSISFKLVLDQSTLRPNFFQSMEALVLFS